MAIFTMGLRQQGKPPVYLLVHLPILLGGSICLILVLINAYSRFSRVLRSAVPDRNGLLIAIPAFFLWLPVSFILSNIVLNSTPPLRRIAKGYAARSGGPSLAEAQAQLLKVLAVLAIVCVPLIVLGFLI